MEKKTLGSFIAVLRKSQGMTQKELAEMLNVSDKTVSHWERDESSPDISIIPVIAEIFNVTCDELLKGEKDKSSAQVSPQKTVKQQKYLFEKSYSKIRTECLIMIGIALAGFAFSLLAYDKWNWSFLLTDFIFFTVSVFGLIIFKLQINTSFHTEDADEKLTSEYRKKSREIFWYSIIVNIILTCLSTDELIYELSLIIAPVAGALVYLILRLTKQITFEKKGLIIEKNIVKTVSAVLVLVLSFTFAFFSLPEIIADMNTPEPVHFESMEDLKSFMETENPFPQYAKGERGTNVANTIDYKNGEYVWQCHGDTYEENLVEFVWRNNEIQHIEFHFYENGDYSAEAMFFEKGVGKIYYEITEPIFYASFPIVILSGLFICIFGTKKKLKNI